MDTAQFFNDFIKKYPIYQNNRTFQVLIDKFKDVFVNDIYEDIPQIFKKLYEQGEIPIDVYNYFLTDIGVSQQLIAELSTNEKLIFIKSLSDFQKYKSTVGLVKSVVQAYGDSVEVYELYVDYNSKQNRWDCKPYLLYKPEYSDGYNKTIPYKIVYEKIPSLLIHEKQLDKMRQDKLGIFPIKTNIIFVTSNYNESITNYLQSLIISVFYKEFYDEQIELLFADELITCSLHQFVLIWMYLILYNNHSFIDQKLIGSNIIFDKTINISIDDLDNIIDEYENINETIITESCRSHEIKTTELDNFYYKYIYTSQTEKQPTQEKLTSDKIKSWLKIENPALINYIIKRLLQSDNITYIINDLIQSIEVYRQKTTSVNFKKYFKYFKTFLPTVDLLPIQNTVYKILYYTKPFHTELLDLTDLSLITSNDKFNNIYFTHFYHIDLLYEASDVLELEVFNKAKVLKRAFENTPVISYIAKYMGEIIRNEDLNIFEEQYITAIIKFLEGENIDIQMYKTFFSLKCHKIIDEPIIVSYINKYIGPNIIFNDDLSIGYKYLLLTYCNFRDDYQLVDIPIHLYEPDLLTIDYGYGLKYGLRYGSNILNILPVDGIW